MLKKELEERVAELEKENEELRRRVGEAEEFLPSEAQEEEG